MAPTAKTHEGNQEVTLKFVSDGANQERLVGYIGDTEISENDRFMLQPGEHLMVQVQVLNSQEAECELIVWQEAQGQELQPEDKNLDSVGLPRVPGESILTRTVALPGPRRDSTAESLFDGELGVVFQRQVVEDSLGFLIDMEHYDSTDGRRTTHAHYRFAVRITSDRGEVSWDPDVHDMPPK